MTGHKKAIFVISVFILIQYVGLIVGKDLWPFSHFPMYSIVPADRQFNWLTIKYKIDNIILTDLNDDLTFPYYNVRYKYAFMRYYVRGDKQRQQQLVDILENNILKKYPKVEYLEISMIKYSAKDGIRLVNENVQFFKKFE